MLSRTLPTLHRFSIRWLIRLLIAVSTFYGFFSLNDVYSYKPFPLGTLKAMEMTVLGHLGLILATLEIRNRWRFLIAATLIPSALGVYFLLWHRSIFTAIIASIALSFSLYKVLQGRSLNA